MNKHTNTMDHPTPWIRASYINRPPLVMTSPIPSRTRIIVSSFVYSVMWIALMYIFCVITYKTFTSLEKVISMFF